MSLVFDPVKHEYWLNGVKLPGVTGTLSILGGYEGIPKHILDAASERGTAVHKVTELSDQGTLDYSELDDELLGYLMGWHKFLDDKKPELITVEGMIHHPTLLYAGTFDRELILDGHLSILDIKSSFKLMPSTAPQTAAYAEAVNAHRKNKSDHAKRRYGLRLTKDGDYELKRYSDGTDFNIFISCLNVHRWIQKHGGKR